MADQKKMFLIGGISLLLAVLLGAFGAHGLEKTLTEKAIKTYQTGVTYQFYHGFGILIMAIIAGQLSLNLYKTQLAFMLGILLFSFNCYLYAVTGIKTFALIVPVGGVAFIIGWLLFVIKMYERN